MSDAAEKQTPEEVAVAKAQEYRAKFESTSDSTNAPDPVARTEDEVAEKPARPEGIPEKFWDAEAGAVNVDALLKSQQDLEARFRSDAAGSEKTDDAQAAEDAAEAGAVDAPVGLFEREAVKTARAAFAETGELSDDHYKALEAEGFDRETVDAYIEGQKVKAAIPFAAAYEAAGSEEGYGEMVEWMRANLDESDIEAYNVQMRTNNPAVIRSAVRNMAARFQAEANVEGNRVGGGVGATGAHTFGSRQEMADAINAVDAQGRRKYDNDPAYRAEVIKKIGNTRRAGIAM